MLRRVKNAAQKAADRLLGSYFARHPLPLRETATVDKGTQILLALRYQERLLARRPLPAWEQVGFRVYSQSDEDGILLYLFALIGTENRKCVEICVEDGTECNTANLAIHHGWEALMFDGSAANIERGRHFYAACRDTWIWPPRLVHAWIEAENVNDLITEHGFAGEIDLLSLDLDGVDYWIWKAIECIRPRVVVAEYQNIWGPERAVTVPYRRDFNRHDVHPDYCGASLAALVKLGREKGYRLVGSNRYGFNAFFVRDGIGEDVLPEVEPASCFRHPQAREAGRRLPAVIDAPWVEV